MALVKTWIRVEGSLSMVDIDPSYDLTSKIVAIPMAIEDFVGAKLRELKK
jgi:hypothetical protein